MGFSSPSDQTIVLHPTVRNRFIGWSKSKKNLNKQDSLMQKKKNSKMSKFSYSTVSESNYGKDISSCGGNN